MRVLVVDDVNDTTDALVRSLEKAGHDAIPAYSEKTALEVLRNDTFDIVVTDMLMERQESGLEVLKEAKKLDPHVEVILLTAYAEVDTAVPAMNMGAFDYVKKSPEEQIYDIVVDKVDRASITKMICDAFSRDEVAVLCLFLGFDYDELPRESKRDKVVHMVNQLSQDNDLHLLEALIRELRPDLLASSVCREDRVGNVTAIMSRIVKKALERKPNLMQEVYSAVLANWDGHNESETPEFCKAILSRSFDLPEQYGTTEVFHQLVPTATSAPMIGCTRDVYDADNLGVVMTPIRHSFLKVDVAEHSKIVKRHKTELVNQTFDRFKSFVSNEVKIRGGEIWSWEGDGGLCVFRHPDCDERAALSATSILTGMQVFNMEQNLLPVSLNVCIAVHTGYVMATDDKGSIHSEAINFVSNLEESDVESNTVCISAEVFGELSERIKRRFFLKGSFEGKEIYVYGG